jgi:hypothetical protein
MFVKINCFSVLETKTREKATIWPAFYLSALSFLFSITTYEKPIWKSILFFWQGFKLQWSKKKNLMFVAAIIDLYLKPRSLVVLYLTQFLEQKRL